MTVSPCRASDAVGREPDLLDLCLEAATPGPDGRKCLGVGLLGFPNLLAARFFNALSAALNDEETRRKLVECASGRGTARETTTPATGNQGD